MKTENTRVSDRDRRRREFILNGNPMAVVLSISMPLMLLGAFTYLSGMIDTIVIAKNYNSALSSVVMISQIKNLFTALGSGFATGGSILVARLIGRNDFAAARRAANMIVTIFFAAALAMVAVFLPMARGILRLAGLTGEMAENGLGYFRIQIVSIGVLMFNSVFLGLEKARGATVNILFVNLMSMSLKLAFTLIFVGVLRLGTEMVAASTLFADLSVTAYAAVMLSRKSFLFRYSPREFLRSVKIWKRGSSGPEAAERGKEAVSAGSFLRSLCALSIPVFLGKFVFSLGKVIVNSLAIGYGEDAPGALGVSNQISGTVTNITNCTEDSESSILSYNLSVKQYDRMLRVFRCALALNLLISSAGFAVLTIFKDGITMYFSDGNLLKAELIGKIFSYEKVGIVALGINSAVNGLIYGLGYTKLSMLCNLARLFAFRIPSMLIMIRCFPSLGAESLGIAMLVSNVGIGLMSTVIGVVCVAKIRKRSI